jgi:hypothetical protein
MVIPHAFSVHNFIHSVGADAGFAAIIGLALLVLLYFAHARETASLRDRLAHSDARVDELEARVAHLMASRAAPVVAPPPGLVHAAPAVNPIAAATAGAGPVPTVRRVVPAGTSTGAAGTGSHPLPAAATVAAATALATSPALARIPSAPAGVAGPSLSAATKLIPTPAVAGTPVAVPVAVGVAVAGDAALVGVGVAATAAGGAGGNGPATAAAANRASTAVVDRPVGPATPVPANGGPVDVSAPAPPPAPAPTFPPVNRAPRPAPPVAPRKIQGRPEAAGARLVPPQRSRGIGGKVIAFMVACAVIVGGVAALLFATSGGSGPKTVATRAATTNVPAPRHHAGSTAPAVKPSQVTVAVLNGTPKYGLAHTISTKLAAAGYKQGAITNGANSGTPTTIVAYAPGHKADADAVAAALKLSPSSVKPVDQATQQVACPQPAACSANVFVTVGADLQNA